MRPGSRYQSHVEDFETHARRREVLVEHWPAGGSLPGPLVRSLQRFQVGEDSEGSRFVAKAAAAGDADYLRAVRLFIAEEQNHARMLARLLVYAGAPTIDTHWSDRVFELLRRRLGLRLELMTLMLAEVVALHYFRALRDADIDPLVTQVAGRILDDEVRHVPFHVDRLGAGFAATPIAVRKVAGAVWWILMTGACVVVAVDHGSALRLLGTSPTRFAAGVLATFRPIVRDVCR